jgi:hypothetical protein
VIGEDYDGFVMNSNLYLLTQKMVVSLWFSFEDFSQVFPMRVYRVYIEWCTMIMIFV